ncbi:MAG: universal stress protein [Planctomycetota bacterium]|nr:universal stress protein [Planctomycetota bacterium]
MPAENARSQPILVAVSKGVASVPAARYGSALAKRLGRGLGLFHVSEYAPPDLLKLKASRTGELELARKAAESNIDQVREALAGQDFEETIRLGDISDETKTVSTGESAPFLIVVGRRKLGMVSRFILGHVSLKIVQASEVPVIIVPPSIEDCGEGPVVIATDLTIESKAALEAAKLVAGDRELVVLHVKEVEDWAKERLQVWTDELKESGANARSRVEEGKPLTVLPKVVTEEKASLLVVATRDRSALEKLFAGGSLTKGLIKDLRCPVLVVKAS